MKLRHEDYTEAPGHSPFILNNNIKRTANLCSESQNWHENIEIQFCKEGEGGVLIDGKCYAFSKGDIALIDSNAVHYTFSKTTMIYSCIIVSTYFCKQMGIDYQHLAFVPLLQNEKLSALFEEICDVYQKESPLRIARLSKLLLSMLILIVDDYSSFKSSSDMGQKELAIVKKVLLYIRENYSQKITLDGIAAYALVDKYTLCKIFKKITDQTLFDNINAYRCMKAAEHISDGNSISETALLCGFENNSYFTKTFKKHMGTLPSKYKNI